MWHYVVGLMVHNVSKGHGAFTVKDPAEHEEFFLDPLKLQETLIH